MRSDSLPLSEGSFLATEDQTRTVMGCDPEIVRLGGLISPNLWRLYLRYSTIFLFKGQE